MVGPRTMWPGVVHDHLQLLIPDQPLTDEFAVTLVHAIMTGVRT